jgi:lysophospholipase L1-like esterase
VNIMKVSEYLADKLLEIRDVESTGLEHVDSHKPGGISDLSDIYGLKSVVDGIAQDVATHKAEIANVGYWFLNLLESGQITEIKLIGDSITVGVGGGGAADATRPLIGNTEVHEANITSRVWANFFREYIADKYPSITFFNAGIGGWSANNEGLTYGTDWYGTDNDFCFIMLGTNDREDCETEAEFETAIETFIKGVEATCNNLIVLTAPPTLNDFDTDGTKNPILNLTMQQIDKVISKVCVKNGWKHISFYREFLRYQVETQIPLTYLLQKYSQGSHPIASGYMLMWKIFQQELGLITNTYDWEANLVDTKSMDVISENGGAITNATLITAFRQNCITYHAISNTHTDVVNFPEGKGGTLETIRPYMDAFGLQRYTLYQIGRTYCRYWVSGAWSAWVPQTNMISANGSLITSSTPITSFGIDCVTYHAISGSHPDVANFPFGLGGILKTVRTYSDSFSYQEFIVLSKGWSAKRYASGSGWNPWVVESNITGNTANRPVNPVQGMMYFDQTLGKPIWYQSGVWKDAAGTTVP